MKKRVLSLLLVLALCLTLLPTPAFAADGEGSAVDPMDEGGGIYVPPGGPTEGGGGTYLPGEDTRTEIWRDTQWYTRITRPYDGTTDGSTVPLSLPFTDGTNELTLREGTDFTAVKTFDSAEAGDHTVTVEIALIGETAEQYRLSEGEESFTIDGTIDPASPDLSLAISKSTCAVGEKLLPLLTLTGVEEDAAVTYYYTPYRMLIGDEEHEGGAIPVLDENAAIDQLDDEGYNTYYIYAKTAATANYKADMSNVVEITVSDRFASVTTADGTETVYGSFAEAWVAAAANEGSTLKLLDNVDIGEADDGLSVDSGKFTLDLDGKTLSGKAYLHLIAISGTADITIKNGQLRNTFSKDGTDIHPGLANAVDITGGTVTLEGVEATSGRGENGAQTYAVHVRGGGLAVASGTFTGAIVVASEGAGAQPAVRITAATLHNGMIYSSQGSGALDYAGVNALFADGSMLFDKDGHYIDLTKAEYWVSEDFGAYFVTGFVYSEESMVRPHTHSIVDGRCECGYTCNHKDAAGDSTVGADGKCSLCGAQLEAVIGETYYTGVEAALEAAQDGDTVKLLTDATLHGTATDNADLDKSITLDLNGYMLGSNGSLTVKNGAALTVTNAGGEKSEKPARMGLYLTLLVEKGSSFTCTDGSIRYLGLQDAGTGDYSIMLAAGGSHCTFGGFAQGDASATVGDLLKATPGMALHADSDGFDVQIARNTLINSGFHYFSFHVGPCSGHQIGADGTCDYCGAAYVASVTTGDGETTSYSSLDDALNAAQGGDTVALLTDVDVGEQGVTINRSITFDLGGKKLYSSAASGFNAILSVDTSSGNVTLKNGTVASNQASVDAIYVWMTDGTLTLEDITATTAAKSINSAVFLGGNVAATILSGDYQGLHVDRTATAVLKGGTFRPYTKLDGSTGYSVYHQLNNSGMRSSRDCMALLAEGCVYVDEAGEQVRTYGGFDDTVTVEEATAQPAAAVAKIGDKLYPSLREAIEAVRSGKTIELLSSLNLGSGVVQLENISKDFTIDLGAHSLEATGDYLVYMQADNSHVTIRNGTLDGSKCSNSAMFVLSGYGSCELTLRDVTATGRSGYPVVDVVRGGTVEFDGGSYTGGVLISSTGNAVLKDGTFRKGGNTYSLKTVTEGKHLSDYLDGDSLFWQDDAVRDLSGVTETAEDVAVRPCEHNWVDGTCSKCRKVCNHGQAEDGSMAAATCPVCGIKAAAEVDIPALPAKYFLTFDKALVCAIRNDGCTLKLLTDVTGTTVMINNPFILDLNGHNVDALSVDARAKIRDSGTTKGEIGKLTVIDTKVPGLTLGDLLEEGYAFRYRTGYWADDSHLQTLDGYPVTVEKAPIRSVALFAKDQNNREVPTTMAYGTTGEVTLVSSCRLSETSGADLSYAWYRLTDDMAIPPLPGATGTSYTLPADLPAGTHTYRVTCTSNHYSKSAEITITVTPIHIEGATVTVGNPTYNGEKQSPTVTVVLDGEPLTQDTDFIVTAMRQTDAGSYKLTVSGTGNYTGEIENVDWKIEPKTVADPAINVAPCVYNGQEQQPPVELKDGDVVIPVGEYTVEYANNTNAGTGTVTIRDAAGGNYVVSGSATFPIGKAAIDLSALRLEQYVFNGLEKIYRIELDALLPELSIPCAYGEITYGNYGVHWTNGAYYDTDDPATVINGVLSLPIKAANTGKGEIGTATVEVITTNYQTFELTIHVIARDKLVPVLDGTVSATDITYGQTVAASELTVTGTMKDPNTGAEVKGTFAWPDNNYRPSMVGECFTEWSFTPAEGYDEYASTTGSVSFRVTPAQLLDVSVTQDRPELSYTGQPQRATVTATGRGVCGEQPSFTYSAAADGPYTAEVPAFTDAGTYTVYYRAEAANHSPATGTFDVRIQPVKIDHVMVSADISKVYDGTAAVTKTAAEWATLLTFQTPHGEVAVPDSAYTISDARFVEKRDGVCFDSADAGEKYGITFRITLHSENYVLQDAFDEEPAVSKEYTQSGGANFTILKAAAPAAEAGALTIEAVFEKTDDASRPGAFEDVDPGSYYEDAVEWAVENGITQGTGDGRFSPDGICTRAQAVTFLWRAAGSPAPETSVMPFTDVPAGSYYYEAVLWAVENGITVGTSDTTFSPNMTCSRAQIVTFLWRSKQ